MRMKYVEGSCPKRRSIRPHAWVVILAGALVFGASWVEAQTTEEPVVEEPSEESSESAVPKISIHGYLNQAYAVSDGNTLFGISEDGTADYRTAALQVRTEISPNSTFALQLSHERFGESELQKFRDDVELDWVFYQHRFGATSIKVGRVQIPFGIYNEVRDVGTLLPFYRPSSNFYGEGAYTSETVDGILLSHRFELGAGWSLEGEVHYGDWQFIERSPDFVTREVNDSRGVELSLETPVPGLRVLVGGMRYDVGTGARDGATTWETYHVSLDANLGRFKAQAEYKYIDFVTGDYDAGYALLGFAPLDRLTFYGQVDFADLKVTGFREGDFDDEVVVGASYAFRPDLVAKLESHWNEGYQPEFPAQNFFAPKLKTRYLILSLSASF